MFEGIDIGAAYVDWTRRKIVQQTSVVLDLEFQPESDSRWILAGVCVVDVSPRNHDEIMLAGILPSFRRKGLYSDTLNLLKSHAAGQDKERVVISTQAANIPALKSWVRSGFEPILSLNTIHIARALIFNQFVNVERRQNDSPLP